MAGPKRVKKRTSAPLLKRFLRHQGKKYFRGENDKSFSTTFNNLIKKIESFGVGGNFLNFLSGGSIQKIQVVYDCRSFRSNFIENYQVVANAVQAILYVVLLFIFLCFHIMMSVFIYFFFLNKVKCQISRELNHIYIHEGI